MPTPDWPDIGVTQANRRLIAPGEPFEIEQVTIAGRPTKVWTHGPRTLRDIFARTLLYTARDFMVDDGVTVTFPTFRRATIAFAGVLAAQGVKRGDRVAILLPNNLEFPVAYFAAGLLGAAPALLNIWWSDAEVARVLADAEPAAILTDARRLAKLPTPAGAPVFLTGEARKDVASAQWMAQLIGAPASWASLPDAEVPDVVVDPEDLGALFYTSGTSGEPKGVVASQRAITINVLSAAFSLAKAALRRGDPIPPTGPDAPQRRALLATPMFHVTGALSFLHQSVWQGSLLAFGEGKSTEHILATIEGERLTALGGVPTTAWRLADCPQLGDYDLSSLKWLSYGGAPASPALARRLSEALPGVTLGQGWGLTETSSTCAFHWGQDYLSHPDSCGYRLPICEIEARDTAGVALPTGKVGEIWIYGAMVAEAYWREPQASAEVFVDGWVRTGDIGRIDSEGFVYLIDRAKDVVIRAGENIYCTEVENVLANHPAVGEAAVLAWPHRTLGEEAWAVVVPRPGAVVEARALRILVSGSLASFKVPARIVFRDEPLPRNTNGKLDKTRIRDWIASTLPAKTVRGSRAVAAPDGPADEAEAGSGRHGRRTNAERTAATRAKLIAATIECLHRHGYADLTTLLVSEMAEVSRGAMLHHFPTKVDLVITVAEHVIHQQALYYGRELRKHRRGWDRFVAVTDLTWKAWSRPSGVAVIEIMVAARSDPDLAARFRAVAKSFEERQIAEMRKLARLAGIHDTAFVDRLTLSNLATIRGLVIDLMLTQDRARIVPIIAALRESKIVQARQLLDQAGPR